MGSDDDKPDPSPFFPRPDYSFNNRIMLTAIISLSVVVVLVTLLHIYARFMLRRQARRRAALRQLGFVTDAHVHSGETPKTGLEPSVIALLPLFVFKRAEDGKDPESGEAMECSVCLSALEEGETVRILPNCNHTFHADCIDMWLGSNSTCPICRSEAEPRLVPVPREGPAAVRPTAPSMECATCAPSNGEGTSETAAAQPSAKISGGSSSRLSSFRSILSRERSSVRISPHGVEGDADHQDPERQ